MKLLVALALLAQILGCLAQGLADIPKPVSTTPKLPGCDDPEVEHVAAIATHYINEHNHHGYKYVLNRIEDVKVLPRRPFGEIYLLELDLLETECHVLDPTPAKNCTIRPKTQHAVEGDCNVKVMKVNGDYKVIASRCHSSPDSAEDIVKMCPNCPVLSRLNDPGVVETVNTALAKFNAENANGTIYKLLEISRGFHTHLPIGVHVEFAIAATNCSSKDPQDHVEKCTVTTDEHAHTGFCKASVITNPPLPDKPTTKDVHVNCDLYDNLAGAAHIHLTKHHIGKNIPSPGVGHTVLDLIHSHNNTQASHESHSAEVPVVAVAKPVVKRAVEAVSKRLCPGRLRHFDI